MPWKEERNYKVIEKKENHMSVTKELFGTAKDGREVYAFTLENTNGMKARVINFGANLVDLYVPDRKSVV